MTNHEISINYYNQICELIGKAKKSKNWVELAKILYKGDELLQYFYQYEGAEENENVEATYKQKNWDMFSRTVKEFWENGLDVEEIVYVFIS
ncbi:hypothetical protein [Bacillus cereus group sp. BcHK114]|uniref:hypothetical protein n=1 Tax=Bacillus cereus group sp. BcHK114 TaxID=3018095 RepID=UPI0022E7E6FB|nr:hypothetical protein [Bacillus cereus group sp. BcHK114]MDA1958180.1 hypothetical protein [Bacillus cereus group sp. BcHK114]